MENNSPPASKLSQTYKRLTEQSKKNPKTNWSRHVLSGIIAGAIIVLIAAIVYSYIVREEDYSISKGDGLTIARAYGHSITPYIDVLSTATAGTSVSATRS